MFSDDGITPIIENWKYQDRPGTPKILSSLPTTDLGYNLTWIKPRETSTSPILYYAVRYRMVGYSKWKNANEILANKTQDTYSYRLYSLEWNAADHEFAVYAGSSKGLGRPATGIIPKGKQYKKSKYVFKLLRNSFELSIPLYLLYKCATN